MQIVSDKLQVQEQLLMSKKGVGTVQEDLVLLHLHSHFVESKSGKAPKHDFAVLLHVH